MKFKVSYSVISWSGGKIKRHTKVVSSENANSAVGLVLTSTQGKGFNFIVQCLEDS